MQTCCGKGKGHFDHARQDGITGAAGKVVQRIDADRVVLSDVRRPDFEGAVQSRELHIAENGRVEGAGGSGIKVDTAGVTKTGSVGAPPVPEISAACKTLARSP